MLAATSPPPLGVPDSIPPSQPSEPPSSVSASPNTDATSSKKTYLSLLPPAQIIEICLLFEPHVPLHVKSTVWPVDLEAAILELKKSSPTPPQSQPQPDAPTAAPTPSSNGETTSTNAGAPSHQVHPPGPPPPSAVDADPPMGSLRDPAEEAREKASSSGSGATTIAAPSPVPQANGGEPSHAFAQPHAGPSQPAPGQASHASTPQPPPQAQHASLHPPAPYPYAPYGYPMPQPQTQQSAYPHAPYYAPPPAYPSHYQYPPYPPPPGYPTPPPGHTPPPPHPHGQHPLFNSNPLVRPPIHPTAPPAQPPPPPPSEDLPSYEEMIVEALLDCGDAEGAAPKDLFTWMAARYPLQTNFRPSASQALQKAYKRGRLEKRAGGKYRLNPAWEGGATSKRTTRRPQTLAQTTYAMHHAPSQSSSPFTHAPLQQHSHPPPAAQPPYNGYPYAYPYGHYPGYPQHPPTAPSAQPKSASQPATAASAANTASSSVTKPAEEKDESGEGSDAWEAAQHILKAINFANLELPGSSSNEPSAPAASNTTGPAAAQGSSGQEGDGTDSSNLAECTSEADLTAMLSALVNAAGAAAPMEPPRASLTEDERAALQAQLALLAAQLTEIAEGEEEEEPAPTVQATAPLQPLVQAHPDQPPQHVSPAPPQAPTPAPSQSAPPTQSAPPSEPPQLAQPSPRPAAELPPPPIAAYSGGSHFVLDINAFPEVFGSAAASGPSSTSPSGAGGEAEAEAPASGTQTEVDELADDDSDDDDMEDVVVPLHPHPHIGGHDAVRT
ncbi:hypothetical protein C8Q77DRAFT_1123138 [Trametes polyzona]|nr:hypothetical protein C8Q77DRAFT_1123138 [Trametes polyzona]